jgi:hypothetical protein
MHSSRMPGRGAEDGASVPAGPRQVVMRAGCAVIACVAAVTLGLSVHHEVQATASVENPSWVRPATAAYLQEKCIYRAIRSELPSGAAVYIVQPAASWTRHAPRLAKLSPLWAVTRLAELSTLWAVPQPTPATARWTVSLAATPGHCSGLALEVRRR